MGLRPCNPKFSTAPPSKSSERLIAEGTRIALLIGLTDELLELALPGEVSRSHDDGFAIRFTGLSREQYLALCDAISTASELIEKGEPER